MGQVSSGYSLLYPPRLSRLEFKALLAARGWRMADAAFRWGVRPETLSRVAADENRDVQWDDLVRSLPQLTRAERAAATRLRLQLAPPRPRRVSATSAVSTARAEQRSQISPPTDSGLEGQVERFDDLLEPDDPRPSTTASDGFRYQAYLEPGSELVVMAALGSVAQEEDILVVLETRTGIHDTGAAQEEYLCETPSGTQLWLTPSQLDDHTVSNGRTRSLD
ncbi:hypothetical protein EGJ52_22865 [Pseudomonas luteola]|uniref:hypothetical protein n=1 Tax=Pseudomonas luteola TaxID=47886 RepID=UPI000F7A5B3E|nr:hypothetical protein [Pseudomonas luteola]RRW40023.1 hypothetical protein EGJ52_22865 [Pseudomonas luteola]